jgi:DNA end-binding protein Ku
VPDEANPTTALPRPFWSGVIAFGLVSVPVQLFVATRRTSIALRMVDDDGVPLERRYVCGAEQTELEREDIVRGYEIDKDRYVVVEDEELEALEPDKTSEIALERFVELADIDPIYFERAYFLVPDREAVRAYRLLAEIMEDSGRAGIATFVMRGKEYLVAIIAERGILRAETLRFEDEIRAPADIGLAKIAKADRKRTQRIAEEIEALHADLAEREDLADPHAERLRALVEHKLEENVDVVPAPAENIEASANVVDLMEVLSRSLGKEAKPARRGPGAARGQTPLTKRSKQELYERAKELDIAGRSSMSKEELIRAIRDVS